MSLRTLSIALLAGLAPSLMAPTNTLCPSCGFEVTASGDSGLVRVQVDHPAGIGWVNLETHDGTAWSTVADVGEVDDDSMHEFCVDGPLAGTNQARIRFGAGQTLDLEISEGPTGCP